MQAAVRDYVAMLFPGGTALVGRNAQLFVTPLPDEALDQASKVWLVEIRSFDSATAAQTWAEGKGGRVILVPEGRPIA